MPSEKEVKETLKEFAAEVESAKAFDEGSKDAKKVVAGLEKVQPLVSEEDFTVLAEMIGRYEEVATFDRDRGDSLAMYLESLARLDMLTSDHLNEYRSLDEQWGSVSKSKGTRGSGTTEPDVLFPMRAVFQGETVCEQGTRAGHFLFNSLRHYSQEAIGRKFTDDEKQGWKDAKAAIVGSGVEEYSFGEWTIERIRNTAAKAA